MLDYEGLKFKCLDSVTGHIKVVFSRGVLKVGFELSGTFIFDEEELKVEEANDYGDIEYKATKKSGKDFEKFLKVIKNSLDCFLDS